jgi:hypothetical protein
MPRSSEGCCGSGLGDGLGCDVGEGDGLAFSTFGGVVLFEHDTRVKLNTTRTDKIVIFHIVGANPFDALGAACKIRCSRGG